MRHGWKKSSQRSGDAFGKWIEIASGKGFQIVTAGKCSAQKVQKIISGKAAHMGGTRLGLGRVPAEQQQNAIMESGHVRHADQQTASDFQTARHFMQNPEQLLGVLQNLIGDDHIKASVCKGESVTLKVQRICREAMIFQRGDIPRKTLNSMAYRFRANIAGDRQIISTTRTHIQHMPVRSTPFKE